MITHHHEKKNQHSKGNHLVRLTGKRHLANTSHVSSYLIFTTTCVVSSFICPILRMRKRRQWAVKPLARGYTARKHQSSDSNPGLSDSELVLTSCSRPWIQGSLQSMTSPLDTSRLLQNEWPFTFTCYHRHSLLALALCSGPFEDRSLSVDCPTALVYDLLTASLIHHM